VLALYKGSGSPLYGSMFQSAVYFFGYGQAKQFILGRDLHDLTDVAPTVFQMVKVGLISGFCSAFVNGPIELIKSKMQVQLNVKHEQGKNIKVPSTASYK